MAPKIFRLIPLLAVVAATGILGWGSPLAAQRERTSGAAQLYSSRPTLRWDRPQYRNFAYQNFSNYPDHATPYEDSRQTYHGQLGDYLATGYNLYTWEEVRSPQVRQYGSSIYKEVGVSRTGGPFHIGIYLYTVLCPFCVDSQGRPGRRRCRKQRR